MESVCRNDERFLYFYDIFAVLKRLVLESEYIYVRIKYSIMSWSVTKTTMNHQNNHLFYLLPILLLLSDYIAIVLSEEIAYTLRNVLISNNGILHISWLNFWITFPCLYLIFMNMKQLYTRKFPFYKTIENIFYASLYAITAIIIVLYIAQTAGSTSRLFIGLFGILSFMNLSLFRYIIKKMLKKLVILQTPVLIIGAGKTAELLLHGIRQDTGMEYKVIGLLEDNQPSDDIAKKYSILGGFDDAERIIQQTGVQHIFIAAPGMEQEKLTTLISRIQPLVKNVGIIPNLVGVPMGGIEIESLFNEKLMLVRLKNNLKRPINRFTKTIFDYTLTIIGTICISPILLAIAFWIYKDSPGPVIFKHRRIGKDGKEFDCYKFRTMCVDAKERLEELLANDPKARAEWEKDFKLKNDPRITRSGAFLRKTSLDDLPQIFNVLKGEMSLVGPRPIIRDEMIRYEEHIADYLMVKPGITGMWQVSGRNDIDYTERVLLDSRYVRNWSVWLDIMLLWRTFKVVVKRKGAY